MFNPPLVNGRGPSKPALPNQPRDSREQALDVLASKLLALEGALACPSSRKEYTVACVKADAIVRAAYGCGDGELYKNAPSEYGGPKRYDGPTTGPIVEDDDDAMGLDEWRMVADENMLVDPAMVAMLRDEANAGFLSPDFDHREAARLASLRLASSPRIGGRTMRPIQRPVACYADPDAPPGNATQYLRLRAVWCNLGGGRKTALYVAP